jgi:hypothetical protein
VILSTSIDRAWKGTNKSTVNGVYQPLSTRRSRLTYDPHPQTPVAHRRGSLTRESDLKDEDVETCHDRTVAGKFESTYGAVERIYQLGVSSLDSPREGHPKDSYFLSLSWACPPHKLYKMTKLLHYIYRDASFLVNFVTLLVLAGPKIFLIFKSMAKLHLCSFPQLQCVTVSISAPIWHRNASSSSLSAKAAAMLSGRHQPNHSSSGDRGSKGVPDLSSTLRQILPIPRGRDIHQLRQQV